MEDRPEAEVVNEVKQVIKIYGVASQRINTGAFKKGKCYIRTANPGTLDFEGYDNHGRFVAIECKRPKGAVISEEQKKRIADINKKGGLATIVTSGEQAARFLIDNKCL